MPSPIAQLTTLLPPRRSAGDAWRSAWRTVFLAGVLRPHRSLRAPIAAGIVLVVVATSAAQGAGHRRPGAHAEQALAGDAPCGAWSAGFRGAQAPPRALAMASEAPTAWDAPFCGAQPFISAVFDHEHPTYGCPPNGDVHCRGDNGTLRLYNDTVDNALFYEGHNGWDYRTRNAQWHNIKRPVFAVADGTVTYAGWHQRGNPRDPHCQAQVAEHERGYGLMLRIDHGGEESLYGHLSMLRVQLGDQVARGQMVAATGSTGNSAGPHLHLGAFRPDAPGLWHAFDPYGWNADWQGLEDRPLPPASDPWHAAGGPRSRRRLQPGASEAKPCPQACGPGVIIDDADPGFATGCALPPCRWALAPGGLEQRLHQVHPSGAQGDHWARWTAPLPPGRYAVDVYLPAVRRPAVHAARYRLGDALDAPAAIVDQHEEGNIWVPLGVHRFRAQPSVTLENGGLLAGNWAYAGPCRWVLADAVRFTALCEAASADDGSTAASTPAEPGRPGCLVAGRTALGLAPERGAGVAREAGAVREAGVPRAPGTVHEPNVAREPNAVRAPGAVLAGPEAYPGPETAMPPATPTPSPDTAGRFPPPSGVPHQTIDLAAEAQALGIAPVVAALTAGDAEALAMRTGGTSLAVDPPHASEGWELRWSRDELRATLDTLLPDREPVIQGLFAPGCRPMGAQCEVHVITTGWPAAHVLPTPQAAVLGPARHATLPDAAAWQLLPDGLGDAWWRAWRAADGYHALVTSLAEAGLGPYLVAR